MRPTTYLSPFNQKEEVVKDISFNKNLTLCDCTLRDGEQPVSYTHLTLPTKA